MKILIAIDGSEFGDAAVGFAASLLGKDSSAEFKIVTVLEPAAGTELETIVESTEQLLDSKNPLFQEAENLLKASAETLRISGAAAVSYEVLAGPTARRIVEAAEEWNSEIIVIGSHGRSFWSRVMLGSVSNSVAKLATCSVLVIRKPK
jgi:nucleotide-binding universal stress UspA family protein